MEVAPRYTSSGEAVQDDIRKAAAALKAPSTPPRATQIADLPTPPTSHIELSASTLPPSSDRSHGRGRSIAETMNDRRSPSPVQTPSTSGIPVEHSPSFDAHRRKAKRMSGGKVDFANGSLPIGASDDDEEDASRGRRRIEENGAAGPSNSRSRTPSPILGSIVSQTGKLSFSAALQPSAEEVRSLLYGENNEDDREEARPRSVGHAEMDGLLQQLESMGLAAQLASQSGGEDGQHSRELKLASMVKKLVDHARKQDAFIDGMEASLHNTRLRSIAMLSSVRTQFAHSFATEYELRARLQAELDGAKAQARKLSQLLANSETRNEELDRERAASAEEEVIWQEEMKDHASAYAQQRAARARAAHLAQQTQATPSSGDNVKQERTFAADGQADGEESMIAPLSSSPPLPSSGGLDEPFEERKRANGQMSALPQSHSEGSLAGLGISAAAANTIQIDAPAGSPLSTIIKERNKLLADKRYLRIRVRDSEAQRERLELELKSLRPLLVRGVPPKSTVAAQLTATPTTPGRSQKRDRSRRRRQAVMGDAEAEHLLLAARRLQTTKRAVDDNGRPTTPPLQSAGVGTANPRTPRTPKVTQTPRSAIAPDSVVMHSGATSTRETDAQSAAINATALDASPLAGRTGAATLGRWGRHERVDSNRSIGGIDDLLHAAQTVLTPGERVRQSARAATAYESEGDEDVDETLRGPARSQERGLFGASSVDESPKRRRVSSATPGRARRESMLSMSPDKALFVAARRMRTQTEGAEPPRHPHDFIPPTASQASALSALDLLADQAAASQVPSQSSEQSNSGEGEAFNGGRSDDSDDGMNVDRHAVGPNGTPHMAQAHYYPRGSYGHVYAAASHHHPHHLPHPHHAPAPAGAAQHPPLVHDGYRMAGPPMPNGTSYGYGPPIGSPIAINSHGWTSQNVPPPGRNGSIYSPPTSHHARFLQSGPRISTGYVATGMQQDMPPANRLAKGHGHRLSNGGELSYEEDDDDVSVSGSQRTPQKGGNTSPDKRLPYVRWSEEEDQKLRRAIGEFGQRWESVARVVGTRTYHQCRQRYLLMRRKEAAAREGGDDISS